MDSVQSSRKDADRSRFREDAQEVGPKYMAELEANCLAELWHVPRSKTRMFLKLEDDDSFVVRPQRENGPWDPMLTCGSDGFSFWGSMCMTYTTTIHTWIR